MFIQYAFKPIAWSHALIVASIFLAASAYAQAPEGVVGPGVYEQIRLQGEARIIIALHRPAELTSGAPLPIERRRALVRALQEPVLNGIAPEGFRLRHRYAAVSALAGTVLDNETLDRLVALPGVRRIDLDPQGSGGLAESVSLIHADQWAEQGVSGAGVVVAVLDSGMDTDHDDLADALVDEACFLDFDGAINGVGQCPNGSDRQTGPGAAEDDHGHGTNVTGIVAANGTKSAPGVAPGASIVAIKVLNGANQFNALSEVVAGMDYVLDTPSLGVQAMNMSLGTFALFDGVCDDLASFNMAAGEVADALKAAGVSIFASSLNGGSGTSMSSPACLASVISVGATDNNDLVASFTNSNAFLDIMAPGVGITASGLGNGTSTLSGTSMASPHAAGCAALLIAGGVATTPDEILERLRISNVIVTDPTNGLSFPRIDCSVETPGELTPLERIGLLSEAVEWAGVSGVIKANQANQMTGLLKKAQSALGLNTPETALVAMNAFIDTVERLLNSSKVDPVIGASWITEAETIIVLIQGGAPNMAGNRGVLAASTSTLFELGTNYPNPFNPTTTIGFVLAEQAEVYLTVHDVLGREVARLVDGTVAAGTHEVRFDASGLPSGVYLYRLVTPNGSVIRRMTLVK